MAGRTETVRMPEDGREPLSTYRSVRDGFAPSDMDGAKPVAVLDADEVDVDEFPDEAVASGPEHHRPLRPHEVSRLHDELRGLIERGEKDGAVGRLADVAGISRLRAAGLVTALTAHPDLDLPDLLNRESRPQSTPSEVLIEEITQLMDVGKKLEAIAHYSERMNVGLKEAKLFIEALDDVTDFECEVAQQVPTGPLLVAMGAAVLLALSVTLAFFVVA
jgi:ribosomal protein L7/L12